MPLCIEGGPIKLNRAPKGIRLYLHVNVQN